MAIEDKAPDGRTVKLIGLRLSFAESLYEKKATVEDGEPKHGSNFILEKDTTIGGKHYEANKAKIGAALKAAGEVAWKKPDAYKDIAEDNPKRVCYRNGNRWKNQDGQIYAGYEGNMAFSASGPSGGKRRPKLYDRHRRKVEEKDILDVHYNGTYCDAIVSYFGTDKGGRGIFCTIEAIRSYQEGDRMGGGVNVEADDFDEIEGDAFEGGGSTTNDDFGID